MSVARNGGDANSPGPAAPVAESPPPLGPATYALPSAKAVVRNSVRVRAEGWELKKKENIIHKDEK